eukprot:269995-Chlamydomonas_euryale.AAC.1
MCLHLPPFLLHLLPCSLPAPSNLPTPLPPSRPHLGTLPQQRRCACRRQLTQHRAVQQPQRRVRLAKASLQERCGGVKVWDARRGGISHAPPTPSSTPSSSKLTCLLAPHMTPPTDSGSALLGLLHEAATSPHKLDVW